MTAIKIEKDVAIPTGHHLRKYPFGEMGIGDSFDVNGYAEFTAARSSANSFGRVHALKFSGRKNDDGGRIWRIE